MMKTTQNQNQSNPALSRYAAHSGKQGGREDGFQVDLALRRIHQRLSAYRVLNLLNLIAPDLGRRAERKGKWLWLQFSGKQPPEVTAILAQLGFFWNFRRQLWQHSGGSFIPSRQPQPARVPSTVNA